MPLNWKFLNMLLSLECNYTYTATLKKVFVFAGMSLSFAYGGLTLNVLTLQCFHPSMFWPFHCNFLWFMQGLKMRIKKGLWDMYSQVCKSRNILAWILQCQMTSIQTRIQKLHWFVYGLFEGNAPESPIKYPSDHTNLNRNPAASRLTLK